MPRYLVERSFPNGCSLPAPNGDPQTRLEFIENNSLEGVIWVYSYITLDRKKSYCICDADTPEAVRRAATRNDLPVDRIQVVSVVNSFSQSLASNSGPQDLTSFNNSPFPSNP